MRSPASIVSGVVLVGLLLQPGLAAAQADADIGLIRRAYEQIWNGGNVDLIDEVYAADYQGHDSMGTPMLEGVQGARMHYRAAFPDVQFTIKDIFSGDGKVAVRWEAHGTHRGDMLGMTNSGKAPTIMGISIFRIADEKIAEAWFGWDKLDMMRQLGADLDVHEEGR